VTQLRKDPEAISNRFDAILAGVGHRGSSFTDIDRLVVAALTHDGYSRRFLFQEFKRVGEECPIGQWWALYDLARQPNTSVWLVKECEDLEFIECVTFKEVPKDGILTAERLSLDTYRERFADWWNQKPVAHADVSRRVIWSDYVKHDPSLQVFIAGEFAREQIALATAISERDHWRRVAEDLSSRLMDMRRGPRRRIAS
jgi:hypothetical protein